MNVVTRDIARNVVLGKQLTPRHLKLLLVDTIGTLDDSDPAVPVFHLDATLERHARANLVRLGFASHVRSNAGHTLVPTPPLWNALAHHERKQFTGAWVAQTPAPNTDARHHLQILDCVASIIADIAAINATPDNDTHIDVSWCVGTEHRTPPINWGKWRAAHRDQIQARNGGVMTARPPVVFRPDAEMWITATTPLRVAHIPIWIELDRGTEAYGKLAGKIAATHAWIRNGRWIDAGYPTPPLILWIMNADKETSIPKRIALIHKVITGEASIMRHRLAEPRPYAVDIFYAIGNYRQVCSAAATPNFAGDPIALTYRPLIDPLWTHRGNTHTFWEILHATTSSRASRWAQHQGRK